MSSLIFNPFDRSECSQFLPFSCEDALPVSRFFRSTSLSNFETPLYSLHNMAARLGLEAIYIKDESCFLGNNSFKPRGALWAAARIIGGQCGIALLRDMTFTEIASKAQALRLVFVTATDGNHGAAVAFAARLFGQKALIFMPRGASASRIRAISELGAQCLLTSLNYDDTVRCAAQYARKNGAILIQDTSWPGYEEIPFWIMQGYTSLAAEIKAQLHDKMPTHIFLQTGVGSFAGAMISSFVRDAVENGEAVPAIICMEAENAACLHKSFSNPAGAPHEVSGPMETIMAGLACGRLSHIAWPILRANILASASCDDAIAELGMRLLADPLPGDPSIVSGECGALGMGLLWQLMMADSQWRGRLGLGSGSRVLLISTEGATDPGNWEKITGESIPARTGLSK